MIGSPVSKNKQIQTKKKAGNDVVSHNRLK